MDKKPSSGKRRPVSFREIKWLILTLGLTGTILLWNLFSKQMNQDTNASSTLAAIPTQPVAGEVLEFPPLPTLIPYLSQPASGAISQSSALTIAPTPAPVVQPQVQAPAKVILSNNPQGQPHGLQLPEHAARVLNNMEQIEFKAMGCHMLAALDSNSSKTRQRLERVPEWFEEWEQCLSRFREDSELSNLNRNAGAPRRVSKVLWDVFQAARQAERSSDGLVTPAVLDALIGAGYDRSFEALETGLISAGGGAVKPVPSLDLVEEDDVNRSIQLPEGLHLDFGGVAKGWAADQAVRRLQVYGPALVDASGDIAVSGPMADNQPWPVGLQNPMRPDEDLCLLALNHSGVATSGKDYRRWNRDGSWKHHIIDPRTGLPATTNVLTATVIAPTVLEAEIAAKVAMISGSRAGLAWIEAHPPLASLLVLEDGQRIYSKGFEKYIWRDA